MNIVPPVILALVTIVLYAIERKASERNSHLYAVLLSCLSVLIYWIMLLPYLLMDYASSKEFIVILMETNKVPTFFYISFPIIVSEILRRMVFLDGDVSLSFITTVRIGALWSVPYLANPFQFHFLATVYDESVAMFIFYIAIFLFWSMMLTYLSYFSKESTKFILFGALSFHFFNLLLIGLVSQVVLAGVQYIMTIMSTVLMLLILLTHLANEYVKSSRNVSDKS